MATNMKFQANHTLHSENAHKPLSMDKIWINMLQLDSSLKAKQKDVYADIQVRISSIQWKINGNELSLIN